MIEIRPGTVREYKPRMGVQLKMAMTYIAVMLAVIVLLNIYPVAISEDFMFQSKQDSLSTRAELYADTLAGLDELTPEGVEHVIGLLGAPETRILVVDGSLAALYDSSRDTSVKGNTLLLNETRAAVAGNDYFRSRMDEGAILSVAASPIVIGGIPAGAVCVYDTDSARAELLDDISSNLRGLSVIIMAVAIVVSLLLSRVFSRRISKLLESMRRVRDGDYSHRAEVRGNDEYSDLAEELNALSERFEAVEEMRKRFVSDASHELKTPLASIKLLADSMVQSDNMPPDTMREFALDIAEETDRLSRIAQSMLNITRLDSGAAAAPEPVDFEAVVRRAARMLEPLAQQNDIRLKLDLEGECVILASDDYAYQIVFNLVENAIKYNRPHGEVHVFLFRKGEEVRLIVSDTGIGIPSADIERIFDRFYRVDKARSRAAGGSGLGLAIVANAVRQYGGSISAESEAGEGTRITVVFPVAREGADE